MKIDGRIVRVGADHPAVHAVAIIDTAHGGTLYRSACGMVLLLVDGHLEWGSEERALVFRWTAQPVTCAWCGGLA